MTERLPVGPAGYDLIPSAPPGLDQYTEPTNFADVPPDEPGGGFNLSRVFAAVLRYKWLVLSIVLLGTAISVVAARFKKPRYTASATIYFETTGRSQSGPIRPEELLGGEGWVQLIRSFAVIDPTVLKTKLYLDAPRREGGIFENFVLGTKFRSGRYRLQTDPTGVRYSLLIDGGRSVETGAVGDSIGRSLGFQWAPPASAFTAGLDVSFTVRVPRTVSQELLGDLKTTKPEGGTFLTVSLTGDNRWLVAQVLNTLVDQFVSVAGNLKRAKLQEITKDLIGQLRIADSVMRANETALEGYRITTITEPKLEQAFPLPSGLQQTQQSVMSNYFSKRIQLNTIQKDRRAIEELIRRSQEKGVAPIDAFHTIAAVRSAPDLMTVLSEISKTDAEVRALSNRYTDEYKGIKDLRARMDELVGKTLPVYANRLLEQLRSQEGQLQEEINTESKELRQIPVRTHTEDKLQREAAGAISLSQNLQNRLQEAKLAELTATPDLGVLDRAEVPDVPAPGDRYRIILMGIGASIAVGLGLAMLLDRIDKRFRYPDQVSQDLGLAILGAVPIIRKERGAVMPAAETAQIVEAFRSIRLNLAHSFREDEPLLFTITSPNAGDGKSLISSNLAISFAEAGYRTLLVDGDTRRGELYRTFGAEKQPGLLDYLEGGLALEQVIRPTSHVRLSLIPCGTRMTRGPELLGSTAMTDLIKEFKNRYEAVIVDSPPLAAGIDPFVLGTATGSVVLVLRAGETDRELAEAKLQLMQRLPTRMLGAVLNHIELGKGIYKYYAYEYEYRDDDVKPATRGATPKSIERPAVDAVPNVR